MKAVNEVGNVVDLTVMTIEELIRYAVQLFIDNDDTALDTFVETFTDGNYGNNDLERIFMYDENYTVFEEISSRLEVIDTRLDYTNRLLCDGFGFVQTFALVLISGKFFKWLFGFLGV